MRQSLAFHVAEILGWLLVPVLLAMALLLAIWAMGGCTRTDQQRVLTVLTSSATAATVPIVQAIQSEEDACFRGGAASYAEADVCVDESRARWAPVLAALDMLAAIDQSALTGEPDLSGALEAYCTLGAALPSLPAPPAVLGACP